MVRFMTVKKIFYRSIQTMSVLLTASLLLMCLFFGYIFFCNLVKMDVPTLGSLQIYVVLSDSMAPVMAKGDAIIVNTKSADELKVGDIISFYAFDGEIVVTHRITKITQTENGPEFATKGDNNNVTDGFVTPGSRVIGEYVFRIPQFGGFLTSIKEKPYVIIMPVAIIILIQLLLGNAEAKLKPAKSDTKTKKREKTMDKKDIVEADIAETIESKDTMEEPQTAKAEEQPMQEEGWQKGAQSVLQQIIGDAKLELNQMKKDAQAESDKIIAEAREEAEQIRESARSEISMMKVYAEKMLEEATLKVALAQKQAQKIIEDAEFEASQLTLAGQKEREQADENIRQLITKLQDFLASDSASSQQQGETSPAPEKPADIQKPSSAAEVSFGELASLRA